jgi:hypothetical protein
MSVLPRRRLLAALSALVVLGAAFFASSTLQTHAAWTDRENVTAGFTAFSVPEPAASPCTTRTGTLGINRVTLIWRVPIGVVGYSSADVEFGQKTNQGVVAVIPTNTLTTITTTGDASAYSTEISGVPLGGTLGDTKTFSLRFAGPGGWMSDWVDACTFSVVRERILNSQITVTASSEELIAESRPASNVNDDDINTAWVNRWATAPTTTYPHSLTFNLGSAQPVTGIGYLPRPFDVNSSIKDYTVSVSTDGVAYTQVTSGVWAQNGTWRTADFARQTVRYVRLTGLSSTSATTFASASEVAVFGTPTP